MPLHPLYDHPPYTPEFCEREYNNLARIPDHPAIMARWRDDAALARRTQSCQLGLPYGDGAGESLDFFPPRRPGAPLLVFIHGGYWRALGKADFSWVAPALVARGAAVAVVDYGLAPATPIEEIARQMLRAHAWLYRHAGELGVDRGRIIAGGHSAGGHMTAMMLSARWREWEPDLPETVVAGGLALSGLYDLEPVAKAAFLADLEWDRAPVDRLSPALFPPPGRLPLVAAVGGDETAEFQRQNALIGRCWPDNVVRTVTVPGCHHLALCDELANPRSEVFEAALELLGL
ncbi:alpha/beta hydrolase [Pigmentiphaga soli]|uniref:Alpha/beta hydrolase n=1 Tax=Pigmentiphaga soli TaxID=1007095 RepID=A0ABP8GX84_9BURK